MILTKAGGLITSESLAAGLPMLLCDVLPGQEEGNAKVVEDGGAGKLLRTQLDNPLKDMYIAYVDFGVGWGDARQIIFSTGE